MKLPYPLVSGRTRRETDHFRQSVVGTTNTAAGTLLLDRGRSSRGIDDMAPVAYSMGTPVVKLEEQTNEKNKFIEHILHIS